MSKKSYTTTAYADLDDFVFGKSLYPVTTKRGLDIGAGTVYPEVNFTLPPIMIGEDTMPQVLDIYKEIMTGVSQRAVDLSVPGFVAEFEWLPAMTFNPDFGLQVAQELEDIAEDFSQKYGTKIAIRATPVDIREGKGVDHMWHGQAWDKVMRAFEGSAKIGNDFLAIESIGGKDVHDEGMMYCDVEKIIFALGILGCRDMEKLWSAIGQIADKYPTATASGDTACGFANTAMVLADRHMIPRTLSAVSRSCSAVRTMVANEQGAIGPDKDCGYEGHHRHAGRHGRPLGCVRAPLQRGQRGRVRRRPVVQRVRAAHQASVRLCRSRVHGTARLRLPSDERGHRSRTRNRAHAARPPRR